MIVAEYVGGGPLDGYLEGHARGLPDERTLTVEGGRHRYELHHGLDLVYEYAGFETAPASSVEGTPPVAAPTPGGEQ